MFFLLIEHEGFRYMGALVFDDPPWCRQMQAILESRVGSSVRDIGDMDISFTL